MMSQVVFVINAHDLHIAYTVGIVGIYVVMS